MELSINIVSYNTSDNLRECLDSILKNVKNVEYEIIVVDNGSCDGSPDMVKREFQMVRLKENKTNTFFTHANNQAICMSRGEYILLLNSDTIILDNTIKDMIEFMAHNTAVGVVSGKVLCSDGRLQTMDWKFHTPIELIFRQEPFIRFFRKKLIKYSSPSIPTETDVVSDGFMLVRRDALFEIGLYDERFLLYFTEDDLCHRLKRAGWKVYYFPDSSIIHKLFGSSKRVAKIKMAYIRTIDTLKYCVKYYELPIAAIISLFVVLGFMIELIKLLKYKV